MSAFTPGPWFAEEEPDYCEDTGAPLGRYLTGEFFYVKDDAAYPVVLNNPANARLISAAPDMYEALKWIASGAWNSHSPGDVIEAAQQALSKADGREG